MAGALHRASRLALSRFDRTRKLRPRFIHKGAIMNKLSIRAVFAVLVAFGLTVAAAGGSDPVAGMWHLDTAKSSLGAGPAVKSQTRMYSQSGHEISLVMTTTMADGKEVTTKTTYQLDGKDYPVTGSTDYDSLSGKQLDANTAEFTLKKGGKKIGTTTRMISADGKTLTSKMSMMLASGEKAEQTLVFHKK